MAIPLLLCCKVGSPRFRFRFISVKGGFHSNLMSTRLCEIICSEQWWRPLVKTPYCVARCNSCVLSSDLSAVGRSSSRPTTLVAGAGRPRPVPAPSKHQSTVSGHQINIEPLWQQPIELSNLFDIFRRCKVKMEVFPSLTVKPDSATPYTDATQVSQIWLKILQQVDFKFYIHGQAGLRGSIFSMEASSLKLSEFLENACGHKLMTCRKQLYSDNLSGLIKELVHFVKNVPQLH